MEKYFINPELFMFENDSVYILYAPLEGVICNVDYRIINFLCDIKINKNISNSCLDKKEINYLLESNIISHSNQNNNYNNIFDSTQIFRHHQFSPREATLFLTTSCNLSCKYCYGNGGDIDLLMDEKIAFAAVDFLIDNAIKLNSQRIQINFHGGGEPTMAINLIRKTIGYAQKRTKSKRIQLETGLTTNGTFSDKVCSWIFNNIDYLNISFDGPPDIQNFHRPLKGNTKSSDLVEKNLKKFDQLGKKYYIRTTVTKYSENHIPDIVDYVADNFNTEIIQIEPMFQSERSSRTNISGPDPAKFIKGYFDAKTIGNLKGVQIKFSGDRFPNINNKFCCVGEGNFAITPDGKITSCFEVLAEDDSRSNVFFFGSYVDGKFKIDDEKLHNLKLISEIIPKNCCDCIAKFHCTGDCRGKRLSISQDNSENDSNRCKIIQGIVKNHLLTNLNS